MKNLLKKSFAIVSVTAMLIGTLFFGNNIAKIDSTAKLSKKGIDENESITIYFKDGKVAYLTSAMDARSDRKGIIWGDKGYIVVENINNPNAINVYNTDDKLIKSEEAIASSGERTVCLRRGIWR